MRAFALLLLVAAPASAATSPIRPTTTNNDDSCDLALHRQSFPAVSFPLFHTGYKEHDLCGDAGGRRARECHRLRDDRRRRRVRREKRCLARLDRRFLRLPRRNPKEVPWAGRDAWG